MSDSPRSKITLGQGQVGFLGLELCHVRLEQRQLVAHVFHRVLEAKTAHAGLGGDAPQAILRGDQIGMRGFERGFLQRQLNFVRLAVELEPARPLYGRGLLSSTRTSMTCPGTRAATIVTWPLT